MGSGREYLKIKTIQKFLDCFLINFKFFYKMLDLELTPSDKILNVEIRYDYWRSCKKV